MAEQRKITTVYCFPIPPTIKERIAENEKLYDKALDTREAQKVTVDKAVQALETIESRIRHLEQKHAFLEDTKRAVEKMTDQEAEEAALDILERANYLTDLGREVLIKKLRGVQLLGTYQRMGVDAELWRALSKQILKNAFEGPLEAVYIDMGQRCVEINVGGDSDTEVMDVSL